MSLETEAVLIRTSTERTGIERTEAELVENIPEINSPGILGENSPLPSPQYYQGRKILLSIGGGFLIVTFIPVASSYAFAATWVILTIRGWGQGLSITAGLINFLGKAAIYFNFVVPTTIGLILLASTINRVALTAADYGRTALYLGVGSPSSGVFAMLQLKTLINFNSTVAEYGSQLSPVFFSLADVAMNEVFQAFTTMCAGALNFYGGYFVVKTALGLFHDFKAAVPHVLGRGTPAENEELAAYLARRKKLLFKWAPGLFFLACASPGMYPYIELTKKLYETFILPEVVAWLGYFPGAWQILFMIFGVAAVTALPAGMSVGSFIWEFLQPTYKWPSGPRVGINIFEVLLTTFLALVSAWQLVFQAQLAGQGAAEQYLSFVTSFFIELAPFMYVIDAVDKAITWAVNRIAAQCCPVPVKLTLESNDNNDGNDSELSAASPTIQSGEEETSVSRVHSSTVLLSDETADSPPKKDSPKSSWWGAFFGCCKGNRGKIPKNDNVFTHEVAASPAGGMG